MKNRLMKKSVAKTGSRTTARSSAVTLRALRGASSANPSKPAKKGSASRTGASVRKLAVRRAPSFDAAAPAVRRRDSRALQAVLAMSRGEQETFFETVGEAEILELFETSYPSELANVLLNLKKFTCRRLFEIVTARRRRAFLDTIALYYYRDYLTSPLPLTVFGMGGARLPNYYAIIGMPRDAGDDEIQDAGKLLLKAFQPESFASGEREPSLQRFEEIRDAFQHLRTEKRRQETDSVLPSNGYLYPRREQSWWNMMQRLLV